MICNRLDVVVEEMNILGEAQNGFRKRRRDVDNLFILKMVFENAMLNKKKVFMFWLILQKCTIEFPKTLCG